MYISLPAFGQRRLFIRRIFIFSIPYRCFFSVFLVLFPTLCSYENRFSIISISLPAFTQITSFLSSLFSLIQIYCFLCNIIPIVFSQIKSAPVFLTCITFAGWSQASCNFSRRASTVWLLKSCLILDNFCTLRNIWNQTAISITHCFQQA